MPGRPRSGIGIVHGPRRGLSPRLVVLIALPLVLLALYLLVALAMVYLATRPEHHPLEAHPSQLGLQYEDVSFKPRGGDIELKGWLLKGSPQAPYLIFVHGIGDQRTGNKALDLAARLLRDGGYNILLFDLRAQGESGGSFVSAGEFERFDVLGAYDFVTSQGAVPGRVGLVSRSYGPPPGSWRRRSSLASPRSWLTAPSPTCRT
jgi:hypothetical protein